MHVLILEDEDAIRSALARGLARGGDTIDAAASVAEARACIAKRRPDALISDLKLPDGTGLELAKELAVPFLLMTGYGTFDDAVEALRLGGCLDFFTKPVALRDLRRALDRVAAQRLGGPQVLDLEGPALIRPMGDWISAEVLEVATVRWRTPSEARSGYDTVLPQAPARRHRQVLAELVQATPSGRLVVNHGEDRWCAWLDAGDARIDWSVQADRKRLLESLAAGIRWLANGAVVECGRG